MKTQYIENIQEGDVVNDYFVATRKDLRDQRNGGKFLGMVFKDRTGDIGGILWNNAVAVARLFEVGDVVNVRGSVVSYQGRLQIRVDQVLPLRENEYDRADLVDEPQADAADEAAFREFLGRIGNPHIKALVDSFLGDEEFMARFRGAAAGKKWHHAYPGGLLKHCLEMARLAERVAEIFPTLDWDLLLAAIFLHDAGKLDEMTQDLFVDYSTSGKMLGHIYISSELVSRRMDGVDGFPEETRVALLHCLLAHHGELVNGSPVVPKTLEALVLYHCDNLDAQADAFVRIAQETRERGDDWSAYIPLIERQIWSGGAPDGESA